jgi:hypothetical protein
VGGWEGNREGGGVMLTPEDELDVLHHDLGRARRRLHDLERAEFDHRVCDRIRWEDSLQAARNRVGVLERELVEAQEAEVSALEHES